MQEPFLTPGPKSQIIDRGLRKKRKIRANRNVSLSFSSRSIAGPPHLCDGFSGCDLLRRLDPLAVLANKIFQPIDRRFRDIEFHSGFADAQIHLARCPAHVSEACVCHARDGRAQTSLAELLCAFGRRVITATGSRAT